MKNKLINAGESLTAFAREQNKIRAIGQCRGIYDFCPFELCKCRESKRPGRPREYAERMPRVTVRLDEETRKLAREIGNGNLSLGLRIAVRIAEKTTHKG